MGSVGEVLPSRDSTRIAKHTFDAAKIRLFSEQTYFLSRFFKNLSRFLLILEIFSYICNCNPKGMQDLLALTSPNHHLEDKRAM